MKQSVLFHVLTALCLALAGCNTREATPGPLPPTATVLPPATITTLPAATATNTPTETSSPTSTPSPSPTRTATPTATPVPTYVKLRGKVTIDQAVCHYGPGAPYLYKYGVYRGNTLEILRRVERGNYLEVQGIGGNNPCWVRQDYMDIQGDLASVQPVAAEDVKLPFSPYYPNAPTGVSARRDGDVVTVFWDPYYLNPGDDSEQVPYLVEAWVCQDGQFIFHPVGAWEPAVRITDEPGCAETSYARLYAVEKHGYTPWRKIPWPAAGSQPASP